VALERVRAGLGEAAARLRRRPRAGEHLSERELGRLRERVEACLDPRLSGVAVRNRAGEVAELVARLDRPGLVRFFTLLVEDFGPDPDAVAAAVARLGTAADALRDETSTEAGAAVDRAAIATYRSALATVRVAAEPRWERLLELLCGLAGGVKLAVDLRAELLSLLVEHPEFRPLDDDLQRILSRLFPPGLLELRRLTWASPAALLEKLIEYEAVHAITSWDDLKNRLDDHDRRCYAFIHPGMPDEPLIFVEVALLDELAGDVVSILDVSAPTGAGHAATTAIFYSISACQRGLAGVNLGDVLIKEVVADLSRDLPKLDRFATLSPIPGFRRWLDAGLGAAGSDLLTPDDRRSIAELSPDPGESAEAALARLLAGPWTDDPRTAKGLRDVLMGLCVDYLLGVGPGRSRDRVANFHLTNGAQVERLNWLANPGPVGMRESYGLMVNYRYDLSRIDANHEQYVTDGRIARSTAIGRVATARRKARGQQPETG
jgi:malonyl-CoA decarboxylase